MSMRISGLGVVCAALATFGCGDNTNPDRDAGLVATTLSMAPSSLALDRIGNTLAAIATEPGYTGVISAEATNCDGLASVSPATGSGPDVVFNVTAIAMGQCVVTVTDASGQGTALQVSVDPAAPPALSALPSVLTFESAGATQSIIASETNDTGMISADGSACDGIASLSASSAFGPIAVFTATATAAGICVVELSDTHGQVAATAVEVTTTTATLSDGYSPATARSVAISINGSAAQIFDLPSATINLVAPIGEDSFAFTIYDESGALGNILAETSRTQAIVAASANVVAASPSAVVAGLVVHLDTATPNAGAAATSLVTVTAYDADGNAIDGSASFTAPVQIAIDDPSHSGTLSLVTDTIQSTTDHATLAYSGGTLTSANIVATTSNGATGSAEFRPTPTFYEIALPNGSASPENIVLGPDGNMWVTEYAASAIARITPAGVVTEFPTTSADAGPWGITTASDGRLWLTETSLGNLAAMSTDGAVEEWSIASPYSDGLFELVDHGDGTIWIPSAYGLAVVPIDGGLIQSVAFPPPTFGEGFGITTTPDHTVYFVEVTKNKVGRTTGVGAPIQELDVEDGARQIIYGPDGNLWFTQDDGQIGRLSPTSFTVTGEFGTYRPAGYSESMTVGADGAIWFTIGAANRIGRVTMDGTVTEYPPPTTGLLEGIATAPDGSLWFCETAASKIGRLVY